MLRTRIKRHADQVERMTQRLADIEASIVALDDEDLLDLADIFKAKSPTPLAESAFAEMTKRKIRL